MLRAYSFINSQRAKFRLTLAPINTVNYEQLQECIQCRVENYLSPENNSFLNEFTGGLPIVLSPGLRDFVENIGPLVLANHFCKFNYILCFENECSFNILSYMPVSPKNLNLVTCYRTPLTVVYVNLQLLFLKAHKIRSI